MRSHTRGAVRKAAIAMQIFVPLTGRFAIAIPVDCTAAAAITVVVKSLDSGVRCKRVGRGSRA